MSDHVPEVLDRDDVLTCTFVTTDMLQRAVAAELGENDGSAYGLVPQPELTAVPDMSDIDDETHRVCELSVARSIRAVLWERLPTWEPPFWSPARPDSSAHA